MWSEAKLGYLLLLGPFKMLETWYAWTLIMIKWLGLTLGRLEPWSWSFGICLNLGLHLEGMHLVSFWPLTLIMHIHLWWAQVLGLKWFKKQFWASIPSRVQSLAFGLEFIHSIQGSKLKHWTWVIMVQTTSIHMSNAMHFTWTDVKVGSIGHYNMGRK